ncbi:MAG: S1 family peptidase [Actinomycetota bacterium]|nr:S1 family peptidase [Actinomycetota bacterium]
MAVAVGLFALAAPAPAIVYGQFDGNLHPQTGAFAIKQDGQFRRICTGTLISSRVFLTASHCTAAAENRGIPRDEVYVTFDPRPTQKSTYLKGTSHTHPEFSFSGPEGFSDPHDIAVIVLDRTVRGITPARLPEEGLLDRMKKANELNSANFVAVGYGTVRESRKTGPQGIVNITERRYAEQSYLSLQEAWLTLAMNEATGDGGTCFGDSGGPHFLGDLDSDLVVSITVTGDAVCKATDKTYRVDTKSARDFLDDFSEFGVVLP